MDIADVVVGLAKLSVIAAAAGKPDIYVHLP